MLLSLRPAPKGSRISGKLCWQPEGFLEWFVADKLVRAGRAEDVTFQGPGQARLLFQTKYSGTPEATSSEFIRAERG